MCMLFYSWLYKEATVQDVQVDADEGSAVVKVIISTAAHGRYKKLFGSRWEGRKGEIAEVKMDCTSVKEKTAFTVQYVKIYNDTNLLQCFLVKTQIAQRFRCTNDPWEIKGKLQMALNAQFQSFISFYTHLLWKPSACDWQQVRRKLAKGGGAKTACFYGKLRVSRSHSSRV